LLLVMGWGLMSSRIIIPDVGGRTSDTTAPASSYDLGQKVSAAAWVGVFVTVGGTVILWIALALLREAGRASGQGWMIPPWRTFLATFVLALVIGVLVACYFGYEWVIKVAVRAWLWDDDERAYQRDLAKKAREEQEEAAARAAETIRTGPMDHDRDPDTISLEQRYWLVAHEMLSRATLGRGKPTREAMTEDGVCTQAEWNTVNEAMQKIGLRKNYTWQAATFEQAWDAFRANFRIQADEYGEVYAWAMKPGQSWKVVGRVG
jgi:hypothetical protein